MNVEEKFNTLLEKSKAATLSQVEKEKIKSYLLDFVAKNPVVPSASPSRTWFSSIWSQPSWRFATSGLAVLLVLLFAGVGISFAAQNALPGEPLYGFKTGVTEKVLAWTKFSDQAKAQYDLSLVQNRLEEIEKVTAENKLDVSNSTDVKQLLDKHIADLNKHVQNSVKDNQPSVGIETDSRLEASLNAHAKILGLISAGKHGNTKVTDTVSKILSDLQDKADSAKLQRLQLRNSISGQIESDNQENGAVNNSGESSAGAGDEPHDIINSSGGVNINTK